MKTLYFHIGTPKTGTTSIQFYCAQNNKALKKKGYVYPKLPFQFTGSGRSRNGRFLAGYKGKIDGKRAIDQLREGQELLLELFKKYDKVVLSEETFWTRLNEGREDKLTQLSDFCKEHEIRLKIIVYLRRQDQYLESWWRQKIKNGVRQEEWRTFLDAGEKGPVLDYYPKLKYIRGVVGKKNLIVRRFERSAFKNGDLIEDFLNVIGIKKMPQSAQAPDVKNQSLSCDYTELKRVLNQLCEDEKAFLSDESEFYKYTIHECSSRWRGESGEHFMSTEDSRKILDRYRESNARVAKEFFGDKDELFEENESEIAEWAFDDRKMFEAAVHLFGKTVFDQGMKMKALEEEIEALRKELDKQQADAEGKLSKQTGRIDRLRRQMDALLLPTLPVRKMANALKEKRVRLRAR